MSSDGGAGPEKRAAGRGKPPAGRGTHDAGPRTRHALPGPPIPIEQARALLAGNALPRKAALVPLEQALGRVLARPVRADRPLPPFDRAAVDGYAVRLAGPWQDGLELPVVAVLEAGSSFAGPMRRGTAVKVMTGAAVPAKADGVVMVEQSEALPGGRVRLRGPFGQSGPAGGVGQGARPATPGIGGRPGIAARGEDCPRGAIVVPAGTRLEAPHVAILASVGAVEIPVFRAPSIGVLTTGGELVEASAAPRPEQIRDSNGPFLRALLSGAGFPVGRSLRVGRDRRHSLARALDRQRDCDVLLITGGVSMGDFDLVPDAVREAGFRVIFHRVALRPGKPLLFGVRGGRGERRVVFALPGNPVSVLAGATEFVLPFLRAAAGWERPGPVNLSAVAQETIRRKPGLFHFVLGKVQAEESVRGEANAGSEENRWPGGLTVREVVSHGSGDFVSAGRANCLIPLGGKDPAVLAGSTTEVHLLEGCVDALRSPAAGIRFPRHPEEER